MNVPGKPSQNKDGAAGIQGRTIFCHAASGYIHVKHQLALTRYKTIASKLNFERIAIKQE